MELANWLPYVAGPVVGLVIAGIASALNASSTLRRQLVSDAEILDRLQGPARGVFYEFFTAKTNELTILSANPRIARTDIPGLILTATFLGVLVLFSLSAVLDKTSQATPETSSLIFLLLAFYWGASTWLAQSFFHRAAERVHGFRVRLGDAAALAEARTVIAWIYTGTLIQLFLTLGGVVAGFWNGARYWGASHDAAATTALVAGVLTLFIVMASLKSVLQKLVRSLDIPAGPIGGPLSSLF